MYVKAAATLSPKTDIAARRSPHVDWAGNSPPASCTSNVLFVFSVPSAQLITGGPLLQQGYLVLLRPCLFMHHYVVLQSHDGPRADFERVHVGSETSLRG